MESYSAVLLTEFFIIDRSPRTVASVEVIVFPAGVMEYGGMGQNFKCFTVISENLLAYKEREQEHPFAMVCCMDFTIGPVKSHMPIHEAVPLKEHFFDRGRKTPYFGPRYVHQKKYVTRTSQVRFLAL